MQLNKRIALVAFALSLLLHAGFALSLKQWNQLQETRYHQALLSRQSLAWSNIQSDAINALASIAARVKSSAGDSFDMAALSTKGTKAMQLASQAEAVRIDIQGSDLAMLHTTDSSLSQERVLEVGWAEAIQKRQEPLSGLTQLANHRYVWVYANSLGGQGWITVARDANNNLNKLAKAIGGEAFIVSSRGREIIATRSGFLSRLGVTFNASEESVRQVQFSGRHYMLLSQPLFDPSQRRIGMLIGVIDATDNILSAQRMTIYIVTGALALFFLSALLFWIFLQHAFSPLKHVIKVLNRLAQGDIDAQPDDDAVQDEEVMQISAGVQALRRDVLNLQMLQEEQARASQQQESLIRNQLRQLADSLDAQSRTEVLRELENSGTQASADDAAPEEAENQLAKLAGILARMSGLVVNQQAKLLKLLQELREAMETQARFMSLQQELEIARSIQQSILPRFPPDVRSVQVAATMIPAKEVGGDFYDYFMIDDAHLGVVVADVSGKGIPAAFFMAISRTLLKSSAMFLGEPSKAIGRLNDQLCVDNEQMMFVTVFFGVLDLRTGAFRYVNAGHNPPVRIDSSGHAHYLPRSSNMALAVLEDQQFAEGYLVLGKSDSLFLFTDGVTEATNPEQQLFGDQALLGCLAQRQLTPKQLLDKVIAEVRKFSRDEPQSDDITCIALQFHGDM